MTDLIGLCVWLLMGMVLSEKETVGFAGTVRKLLAAERRSLEKAGWNVDFVLATLDKLIEGMFAGNEAQEASKRQAKEATNSYLAVKRQAYVTASGYLDMAIAAVGKDTDAAKNLRRYRSRTHRPVPGELPALIDPVPPPPR